MKHLVDSRVGVLDYGSGNLHSVSRALGLVATQVIVSRDPAELFAGDALVVPGVGAYAACMAQLRSARMDRFVVDWVAAGRKTLGICVGHQIMFTEGDEHGLLTRGLGMLPARVERLTSTRLPHMGWNTVSFPDLPVFAGLGGERFYFVHSYGVHDAGALGEDGLAWSEHDGDRFIAALSRGSLTSTQFHPEKSGQAGLRLLGNWLMG